MSWTVIKELKEKRAKAFTDAQAIRELANKEDRDLSTEEEKRHADFLGDVEKFAKRLEREERASAIGEAIDSNKERMTENVGAPETNQFGMADRDYRRYSLLRAIQCRIEGRTLDGIEGEISKEIEKRTGKPAQGFYMPNDLPTQHRHLRGDLEQRSILDTTQGSGAVPTLLTPNFIEILRNRLVMARAGCTFLPNMTGNFAIPKQTAAATATWVADGSPVGGNIQTVGQVTFSPNTVGAYTDISRKFLMQSVFDAEMFVRNDLTRVLAIELDRAGINGSGSGNQPTGLLNIAGIPFASATATAPTWAEIVKLETTVAAANADFGTMSYITNAKVRGLLKSTLKAPSGTTNVGGTLVNAVASRFVWENNVVNDYPAYVTNIVPSNETDSYGSTLSYLLFGNFESAVYAMWGGLDILVDPYTGSSSGTVRIVALQDVDFKVRYNESFAVLGDLNA